MPELSGGGVLGRCWKKLGNASRSGVSGAAIPVGLALSEVLPLVAGLGSHASSSFSVL